MKYWRFIPFSYSKHPVSDFFATTFPLAIIAMLGFGAIHQASVALDKNTEPMQVAATPSPQAIVQSQQNEDIATGSLYSTRVNRIISLDPCTGRINNQ